MHIFTHSTYMCMHRHTDIHIYIQHPYAHTRAHPCMHTHPHICAHRHMHTGIYTQTHTCTYTYSCPPRLKTQMCMHMHMETHTSTDAHDAHTRSYPHRHIKIQTHKNSGIRQQAHTHACTQTQMHRHMQRHKKICAGPHFPGSLVPQLSALPSQCKDNRKTQSPVSMTQLSMQCVHSQPNTYFSK